MFGNENSYDYQCGKCGHRYNGEVGMWGCPSCGSCGDPDPPLSKVQELALERKLAASEFLMSRGIFAGPHVEDLKEMFDELERKNIIRYDAFEGRYIWMKDNRPFKV